jgi:hypothetical protein
MSTRGDDRLRLFVGVLAFTSPGTDWVIHHYTGFSFGKTAELTGVLFAAVSGAYHLRDRSHRPIVAPDAPAWLRQFRTMVASDLHMAFITLQCATILLAIGVLF